MIEGLRQGHRRYHSAELRKELLELKTEVWERYELMKVGSPTENDQSRPCNAESPSGSC